MFLTPKTPFCAPGGSKMTKMGVKNQNFKKSLCTPLDTSKRHLWSKFQLSRAFLASDLKFGVILRYCAICAQNPFSRDFQPKSGKKITLAILSSTKVGLCVYHNSIYHHLHHLGRKMLTTKSAERENDVPS